MSTITEAVFKGRIRRGALNIPKPAPAGLPTQLMARRAVEAVLAGGYTRCDAPPVGQAPAAPAPADDNAEYRKLFRHILIWVGVFALAGVIAISTSRLPGHAVKATPGARDAVQDARLQEMEGAPEISDEALAEEAFASSAVEGQAFQEDPGAPAEELQAALPPQPLAASAPAPVQVALAPVTHGVQSPLATVPPAFMTPVRKDPGGAAPQAQSAGQMIAVTPDDRQMGQAGGSGAVLEEVLYEGEPAAQVGNISFAAAPRTGASAHSAAPTASRPAARNGDPRVEGIFWDKVRPMAIVNGEIVEVGHRVGAYTVAEIKPGLVTLTSGNKMLDLRP